MKTKRKIQTITVNNFKRLIYYTHKPTIKIDWEGIIVYIMLFLLMIPMAVLIYAIFILLTKPV